MATVHPKYIKSSNLIILSIIIGFISLAIAQVPLNNSQIILSFLITVLVMGALAYGIRKGISWIKYVLLILFLLGTASMIISKRPASNAALIVNIAQSLIQLWALVLLFTIPKNAKTSLKTK